MKYLLLALLLAAPAFADEPICGGNFQTRLIPGRGNVSTANLSNAELAFQVDTCLAQIAVLQNELATMRSQCAQCKNGQAGQNGRPGAKGETGATGAQGPKGEPGEPGNDGADGKDVDYEKVWEWLRKQPIKLVRLGKDGEELDSIEVYLGGTAKFPPMTVNYRGQDGQIVDTEYVPIGGTLDLRIDVLKK